MGEKKIYTNSDLVSKIKKKNHRAWKVNKYITFVFFDFELDFLNFNLFFKHMAQIIPIKIFFFTNKLLK